MAFPNLSPHNTENPTLNGITVSSSQVYTGPKLVLSIKGIMRIGKVQSVQKHARFPHNTPSLKHISMTMIFMKNEMPLYHVL